MALNHRFVEPCKIPLKLIRLSENSTIVDIRDVCVSFSEVEERVRGLLNLSTEEFHRRGIEALLEQELRPMETELLRLLMRYGIQDVFEMETLCQLNHNQLESYRRSDLHQ